MTILEHHFNVKPLSANKMFAHVRKNTYKTADYRNYQEEIRNEILGEAQEDVWPFGSSYVRATVIAGLSNRGADIDNVIKPLLDTYQGIFSDFNDNKVYHIDITKDIVKKGSEYLKVKFEEYHEPEEDL